MVASTAASEDLFLFAIVNDRVRNGLVAGKGRKKEDEVPDLKRENIAAGRLPERMTVIIQTAWIRDTADRQTLAPTKRPRSLNALRYFRTYQRHEPFGFPWRV